LTSCQKIVKKTVKKLSVVKNAKELPKISLHLEFCFNILSRFFLAELAQKLFFATMRKKRQPNAEKRDVLLKKHDFLSR
jgi:hypothetical protein